MSGAGRWVHTWTAAPQLTEPGNLPPPPFTGPHRVLADATVRQTIRVSVGGPRIRLRFSNAFGRAPLPITAVGVARPLDGRAGVAAVHAGTSRPVTFHGRPSVLVPAGAQVVSDPLTFDVASRSNLAVTVHLAQGQAPTAVTSHPGSRTTSHLWAGDHVHTDDPPGATAVDHWYLLSGLEVWAGAATAAAVMLGDSLTDGRGSTTNGNDRWPDRLLDRLHADPSTSDIAVLNQGIGGNRVLTDGLGPGALARLDRDVLGTSGVRWLVVFEGVNDIGTAEATEAAQARMADDLVAAYDQIVVRARAHDIRVYGVTLPPFGGNEAYDDPAGRRAATRRRVNDWIRAAGRFDAVIDVDAAARDPADPRRLLSTIDDGDHLHLNQAGHRLVADSVPLGLFAPVRPRA